MNINRHDRRLGTPPTTRHRWAGRTLLMVYLATVWMAGCDSLSDWNEPARTLPTIEADATQTSTWIQAEGTTAPVFLDARASIVPDETEAVYTWMAEGEILAEGKTATVELPTGSLDIQLIVTDGSGEQDVDDLTVTVVGPARTEAVLTIDTSGPGQVSPAPGSTIYEVGATIAILAIPDDDAVFAGWQGDVESDQPTIYVLLQEDTAVTAVFNPAGLGSVPRFFLPWTSGQSWTIGQDNNGTYSHVGHYAWDIPMPTGTPILASGAGRVIETLATSLPNSEGSTVYAQPANFVAIDHGESLYSLYAHLDHQGVTVQPGQWVVRGQVIGFAGNTGASTAPHLHYEVLDVQEQSVSTGFFEVDAPNGIPHEGMVVTSVNRLETSTFYTYTPSQMSADAFVENQVLMTGDLPPRYHYTAETDYTISGQILDGSGYVCAALVDPDSFETVFCDMTEVPEDGYFEHTFRIPESMTGRYWMGVITGDGVAEGYAPYSVLVSAPVDQQSRPVAIVDEPLDPAIEFGDTRVLSGGLSYSPYEKDITYQWMQSAGPPTRLEDPTAAQTTFTLDPGAGTRRVSFQLVVSDGTLYSFPAQVDFELPRLFYLDGFGVSDELCYSADGCRALTQPESYSLEVGFLQFWAETVNVMPGDVFTLSIRDASGALVAREDIDVGTSVAVASFWRFVFATRELDAPPGLWHATLRLNEALEAEVEFEVTP